VKPRENSLGLGETAVRAGGGDGGKCS
jgi:hypothetical protein